MPTDYAERFLNKASEKQKLKSTYDTPLSDSQQRAFNAWVTRESIQAKRNLGMDKQDYDLQGFWLDTKGAPLTEGHLTDKFKKPNHPTFSDQSIYSRGENVGGKWTKDSSGVDVFTPSIQMLNKTHNVEMLKKYFAENEPEAKLILPTPYRVQ